MEVWRRSFLRSAYTGAAQRYTPQERPQNVAILGYCKLNDLRLKPFCLHKIPQVKIEKQPGVDPFKLLYINLPDLVESATDRMCRAIDVSHGMDMNPRFSNVRVGFGLCSVVSDTVSLADVSKLSMRLTKRKLLRASFHHTCHTLLIDIFVQPKEPLGITID